MGRKLLVLYLTAVLAAACGAATDLTRHKIYNKLTISVMWAGIFMNLFFFGIGGLKNSLLGLGLGSLCILLWILGMLKAGDVKLYMAVGAAAGWKFCGYTVVFSILIGGVCAAGQMVWKKSGRASLRRVGVYLTNLLYTRQFHCYRPESQDAYFSFGSCIFAGTLAAVWLLCF